MDNKNEELAVMSGASLDTVSSDMGFDLTTDLITAKQAFSSLKCETPTEKKKYFNAINNPDKRLGDMIGETIKVTDLYVEVVQCTNQQTGEVTNQPRIVFIDDKGVSYQCVSLGIYNAVKKMITVYGLPTWAGGISVKVKQINKNTKKILSLIIA